jgi:hypothetical protein
LIDPWTTCLRLIRPAMLIGWLCVPKTLSTLCDQAVFVDEAAGVSLSPDAVPVEIDRFG